MALIDPSGTCRIYYGCPNHANSSFPKPKHMAEIRHIEFHFHLQEDTSQEPITENHPSIIEFKKCPIWHFMDPPYSIPKPTLDIILTNDGRGKLPDEYDVMLSSLYDLMRNLMVYGFEHVVVKLEGSSFGNRAERRALRHYFEASMGPAIVVDGREGRHMKFNPGDHYDDWLEDRYVQEAAMY